jgi:polar amino acid transport system substrate-binding protein
MNISRICLAIGLPACLSPALALAMTVNPAITLATLEYPPFCDSQKPGGGALVTIVREAFAQEDIPVNLVVMPWQRVISLSQHGRFDGVIGIWQTDLKSMRLKAGNPVFHSLIGAYVVQGKAPLPLTSDWLQGKLAGTVAGYHYPGNILGLKMVLDSTRDDETNLRKLQQQRIQLAITEKAVGDALLRSDKLPSRPKLAWGEIVLARETLSVGFAASSMRPYWLNAFNQGLWKLHQSGRYRQIVMAHQLQEFAIPAQAP